MKFQGAIIKEQGISFAIIIVKMSVLSSSLEREKIRTKFAEIIQNKPIILMAQDSHGIPKYWGRKDIVNFLAKIDFRRIPWKEFTI